MKEQVVIVKTDAAALCMAIPLYRYVEDDVLDRVEGYVIAFKEDKPLAYLIDCGEFGNQFINAEFVEKNFEFLGDL